MNIYDYYNTHPNTESLVDVKHLSFEKKYGEFEETVNLIFAI